jgi:hypothetical protein
MKRIVESTHLPLRMSGYASAFQGMTLTPPTPMMRMSTPATIHRQRPEQRRGRYCSVLVVGLVRFGALEEVFMSYRPHGAWRTMEVLKELA